MKRSFIFLTLLIFILSSCRPLNENPNAITDIQNETVSSVTTAEDTTVIETEPETEPPVIINELSLIFAGDVLLHDKIFESGKMADGTYNYDHLFANVSNEISSHDIAIVNQEVILGGRELGLTGYPSFNGAHEVGDALVKSGFDVVLHATNHALDKGKKGLSSCISFWESSYPDIAYLGIYKNEEDSKNIYTVEKNGITVSILNYTYGTNGIALPSDMPWCVELLNEQSVRSDVARAKEISDFVIVCPHWGTEYITTVDANQKYYTNLFFELGVDLVVGTHPHVIEPVEVISNEEHSMTVYYSLGNYVNATAQTGKGIAKRMLGALASVVITEENGEVYISDYGVLPIVSHVKSGAGAPTVYYLSEYTEELARQNEIIYSDSEFSLSYLQSLASEVFGDLYK